MDDRVWTQRFRGCYEKAAEAYRAGGRNPAAYFDAAETAFLDSIGCSAQEVYDFAEDWCAAGEPAFAKALAMTSLRRRSRVFQESGRGRCGLSARCLGSRG